MAVAYRQSIFLRGGFGFFRGGFLSFVAVENNGPVLCPFVCALAIEGSRIMGLPEGVEDLRKGDHLGIKFDLDDLGVAGLAGTNILVSGVLGFAAGVATHDTFDSGKHLKQGFSAPEAAAAQDYKFCLVHGVGHSSVCCKRGERTAEEQADRRT